MLVLRRKLSECIILSGGIKIMITEIGKNYVKLGIDAPPQVHIRREELKEILKHEHNSS